MTRGEDVVVEDVLEFHFFYWLFVFFTQDIHKEFLMFRET